MFSSDKKGISNLILELTMMTILALKNMFDKDKLKELLENSKGLRETYLASQKSKSLEKIVKFLAPLKEEKIGLYFDLFKIILHKDTVNSSVNCSDNIKNYSNTS